MKKRVKKKPMGPHEKKWSPTYGDFESKFPKSQTEIC